MLQWKAFYKDGTELPQYGINGKNQYPDIDRSKLAAFAIVDVTYIPDRSIIVPLMSPDYKIFSESAWHVKSEKVIFRTHLEPGQRLIYRLLGAKQLNARTMEEIKGEHFFMVGWQQNIAGQNVQSITYVCPDGRIEQTGKFLGGSPNLLPGETSG